VRSAPPSDLIEGEGISLSLSLSLSGMGELMGRVRQCNTCPELYRLVDSDPDPDPALLPAGILHGVRFYL